MATSTSHRLLAAPRLPRSKQVLVLVDFINPLDFPGGEKLARPAVAAARATAKLGAAGEVARLLYPQANDITILKPRHSAFFGSPLELLLDEMGADDLVICGLATDICGQLTAMDAFLREYGIWVPSDCTAAESPGAWKASIAYMTDILRCDTRPAVAPRRAKKA